MRPRVLYWYRTPPGVKVGRPPFDVEVRRTLEAQYPGVAFDWKTFESTPVPAPEPEYWRERRRAERVAKQARQLEEEQESETTDDVAAGTEVGPVVPSAAVSGDVPAASEPMPASEEGVEFDGPRREAVPAATTGVSEGPRRRRGGRRRRARLAVRAGGIQSGTRAADASSPEKLDLPSEAPRGDESDSE